MEWYILSETDGNFLGIETDIDSSHKADDANMNLVTGIVDGKKKIYDEIKQVSIMIIKKSYYRNPSSVDQGLLNRLTVRG